MDVGLTASQAQRIREVGGEIDEGRLFPSAEERDQFFLGEVSSLQGENRRKLQQMARAPKRNPVASLEVLLAKTLNERGFIEVKTPMMMPANGLTKMGIAEGHPLLDQVFWLGPKKCLRPMLAPNLYFLMRHLKRTVGLPLRLFEIGPCFRKESHGNSHLEEFTMMNLVELGPRSDAMQALREHASAIMDALGLTYALVETESEVYGNTLDVEVDGVEIASGAIGPLPMDEAHGITDPWAGIGFGLERTVMMQGNGMNIRSVGRSLTYLNGARIDI